MPIVFAENFQYDDALSIVQRYPGSQRPGTTAITKGWPLRQGPTLGTPGQSLLVFKLEPFTERIEVYLRLTFDGSITNSTDNATLSILGGIELVPHEGTGVAVRINGNAGKLYRLKGDSYRSVEGAPQKWNIKYDRATSRLEIIVDGKIALSAITEEPDWQPTIGFTSTTANGQASTFNNTLTQIVVANDEAVGTIIDSITFEDLTLSVIQEGGWTSTDTGIIEDTDKDNGTDTEPYVLSGGGELELGIPNVENEFVKLYLAGNASGPYEISADIAGNGDTLIMSSTQKSLPTVSGVSSGSTISLLVSKVVALGIGIPGEIGFGVGICPEGDWLTELNLTPMPGYRDPTSPNYGNYQHSNGSICVFIPKFYYRIGSTESPRYAKYGLNCIDIVDSSVFESTAEANAAGYALHRAFIDGGKEKPGFFYDKYVLSREGDIGVSVKNGQPISLATTAGYVVSNGMPGCTGIYADAVVLGRARGTGWSCISLFAADALAKISLAHGQAATSTDTCAWYDPAGVTNFPKGCNNNALGDQDDPSIVYVSSGEADANKPLTGSANHFAKTTHNGQDCGVCDVNGVIYQMALGITNPGISPISGDPIGSGNTRILKESVRLSDLTGGWNGATDAWTTAANMASKYDLIVLPWGSTIGWARFGNDTNQVFSDAVNGNEWLKSCSGIQASTAGTSAAGAPLFGNDGCYQSNRQNMFLRTAGSWSDAQSGVWYRYWGVRWSSSGFVCGVRVCGYGS